MGKLYIAYGSNLNLAQMAARCPSASIYAAGLLNNWELIYRGTQTNSHATIRRKKAHLSRFWFGRYSPGTKPALIYTRDTRATISNRISWLI